MTIRTRIYTFLCFVIPVIIADQITKALAKNALGTGRVFTYLGGMIRLQYAENPGAFLGMGSNLPPLWRTIAFSVLPFVLLAILAASVLRAPETNRISISGAALVFGGGLGNLVDRILFQGMVTDFALISVGPLRTGIFNVADIAITTGVLLLIFFHLIREPFKKVKL
jgi:signal peptidase II